MQDDFRFRLCGPLSVWRNGRPVEIPQAKHRVVLAALLLRVGRTVTAEELIQCLWGDRPPVTARKTLQGYIARLRKTLGPELLASRSSGYALLAGPEQLDIGRFERLVERAERATGPEERARLLAAALKEVNGTPLVDVASKELRQGDGAALLERVLQATETWADAEMAVGRYVGVLSRLRSVVSAHPLRESSWCRLVEALHGAGRRADALDTYTQAHRLLTGEFGVEPGEELRAIRRQILSEPHDASGESAATPSALPAAPLSLCTLPPNPAEFARPEAESALTRCLLGDAGPAGRRAADGARTVVLHGPAGAGKTTLAVRVAHAAARHFPDGVLHVELHNSCGVRESAQVMRELVQVLGVGPAALPKDPSALLSLYRALLSQRRVLLVLDGAVDEAHVRPLLPSSPGCAAMVTSLGMLPALGGARHLRVGLLTHQEARDILVRMVGERRVSCEPHAARQLVERCGRLPLAVRIVGARLLERPHWRLSQLADRLREERGRLDELAVSDLSVRDSFARSYAGLAPPLREAFRLLGLLGLPYLPVPVAAAALGLGVSGAEDVLESLRACHLLEAEPDPVDGARYRFPTLLQLYARERSAAEDPARRRHEATRRALTTWSTLSAPPRAAASVHGAPSARVPCPAPAGSLASSSRGAPVEPEHTRTL
jgi:DNA-binding SARP family transcriptional activator